MPLYVFLRRRGSTPDAARDTVQGFFAWILKQNTLARADRQRGRFRTFLIASLKQFAAREHQYANAEKRRPKAPLLSIDVAEADDHYPVELAADLTPDRLFDYRYALSMIQHTMQRLEGECDGKGKGELFRGLRGTLTGTSRRSGRELAVQLGLSEGALRVALHRMRLRFGELLRDEIAQTLANPEDVDNELRSLLSALDV